MVSDSRDVGQFGEENIESIHQFFETFLHLCAAFVLDKCRGKLEVPLCVDEAFNSQPRNATLRLIGRSSTPRPKQVPESFRQYFPPKKPAACVLHKTFFFEENEGFFFLRIERQRRNENRWTIVFCPTLRCFASRCFFRTPSWWRWLPGAASGPTLRRWTRRLLPGRRRPMDGVMFHVALDLSTSGAQEAREDNSECFHSAIHRIFTIMICQYASEKPQVHLRRRTTSIHPGRLLLGESHRIQILQILGTWMEYFELQFFNNSEVAKLESHLVSKNPLEIVVLRTTRSWRFV